MKKFGFTLAETLITLGIIGVVAAMTIPTLVANYQKTQTVNKLKKAYAEITQALKLAEDEHGSIAGWDLADFPSAKERNKYFTENYLFPNLKIANSCIPSNDKCWSGEVKTLDGDNCTSLNNNQTGHSSFITLSGYSVYYWLHSVGTGGYFFIDINGSQKPNILGKDVFVFIMSFGEFPSKAGLMAKGLDEKTIKRQDLIDANISDTEYQNISGCKKNGGSRSGYLCAALIIHDGWKISDDYPW